MNRARTMPFPTRRGERARLAGSRHRRREPLLVRVIGAGDQVVEIVKPHNRPGQVSPEVFASLPPKLVVRAVWHKVR